LQRSSFGNGTSGRKVRRTATAAVLLLSANALVLNIWLSHLGRLRVDLTQRKDYSLSPATKTIVGNLHEPLLIRAYLSETMPSYLAPIAPKLHDILLEYQALGVGEVRVEFVDPSSDPKLAKEALELYNISPAQLPDITKTAESRVSTYFGVLVKVGSQQQVLSFDDLVTAQTNGVDFTVQLRSVEYAVTTAIKKVSSDFQDLPTVLRGLRAPVQVTAYLTQSSLPANLAELPKLLTTAATNLQGGDSGLIGVSILGPNPAAGGPALLPKLGIAPLSNGNGTDANSRPVYATVIVQTNGRSQRMTLPAVATPQSVTVAMEDAIRRTLPGFTKVVALWTPPAPAAAAPVVAGVEVPQPQPPQTFTVLAKRLMEANYEVIPLRTIKDETLANVDVAILAGPSQLHADEAAAIDQFVMRGGSLILLQGRYRLEFGKAQGLVVERVDTGLEDLLRAWGDWVRIPNTIFKAVR